MSSRVSSVIGWICSILVSIFTVMTAVFGMLPTDNPAVIDVNQRLGISEFGMELGITKIIIVLLYLFPRTSTVGFVLLVGYYGGALATNITHGFTFMEALGIYIALAVMTIGAWFRNPELTARLLGKPVAVRA